MEPPSCECFIFRREGGGGGGGGGGGTSAASTDSASTSTDLATRERLIAGAFLHDRPTLGFACFGSTAMARS